MSNITDDLQPLARDVSRYHLDPINARTGHDLEGIAESLRQYGQRVPIVVNMSEGGRIIKGNGTYQAATLVLGWDKIAAIEVEEDASTATGFALADNELADRSRFDPLLLAKAMQQAEGVYTGYTPTQAQKIMKVLFKEPPAPPEEFPEYDESIDTDYCCPKCGYEWAGKPR